MGCIASTPIVEPKIVNATPLQPSKTVETSSTPSATHPTTTNAPPVAPPMAGTTLETVSSYKPKEEGMKPMPKPTSDGKHPKKNINSEYTTSKTVLGKGGFSIVYLGRHIATGNMAAIKVIDKAKMTEEDRTGLVSEVDIQSQLHHHNIVRLFDFYEDESHFMVVTEVVSGGELFDRIVEKEFYGEEEARHIVLALCDALRYCHGVGVTHRDLKPENILVESVKPDAPIKIADFGFASFTDGDMTTACGTPNYVAPEILIQAGAYDSKVDMWSLGVITYVLLAGFPPFHHENTGTLFKMIKKGEYQLDPRYWSEVSDDAKDFISRLIKVNPEERFSAEQALNHVWLKNALPNVLSRKHLSVGTEYKKFNARMKLKGAMRATRGIVRMKMMIDADSLKKAEAHTLNTAENGMEITTEEQIEIKL